MCCSCSAVDASGQGKKVITNNKNNTVHGAWREGDTGVWVGGGLGLGGVAVAACLLQSLATWHSRLQGARAAMRSRRAVAHRLPQKADTDVKGWPLISRPTPSPAPKPKCPRHTRCMQRRPACRKARPPAPPRAVPFLIPLPCAVLPANTGRAALPTRPSLFNQ